MYSEGPGYLIKEGIKEYRVINLLYFFRDYQHMLKFLRSPLGRRVEKKVIDKLGIRILNNNHNFHKPPKGIASRKPIFTLDDVKGLKVRMFSNKVTIDSWRHLGANTIVIPYHDTYMALKQGVVDALTSTVSGFWSMKFLEVVPYLTMLKQYRSTEMFFINEKRFQGFSKEYQKLLIDAANDASDYVSSIMEAKNADDIQKMIKVQNASIIYVNTKPWRDKMQPYIQKLIENGYITKEVYETAQAIK